MRAKLTLMLVALLSFGWAAVQARASEWGISAIWTNETGEKCPPAFGVCSPHDTITRTASNGTVTRPAVNGPSR